MSKCEHNNNDCVNSTRQDNEISGQKISPTLIDHLKCPITLELMVDPVTAEDGYTYERTAIETWLKRHPSSPLNPGKTIHVTNLVASRVIKQCIETVIESGVVDRKLSDDWKEKKREMYSQKLFEEGSIMEAAKMGLAKAQGEVAEWFFAGTNGMKRDRDKWFEWATKAANGNDKNGQFQLANTYSYASGWGFDKDLSLAISWYKKAANQDHTRSMLYLGDLYDGIDDQKAASWFEKAAKNDESVAMLEIGKRYYSGKGVSKDHKVAREWFEKASEKVEINDEAEIMEARYWLGTMMMMGEGGEKNYTKGLFLIEDNYEYADDLIESFAETLKERILST